MINLAVINLKDIIKILKKLIIISLIVIILCKIFSGIFKKAKDVTIFENKIVFEKNYLGLINKNILLSNYFNNNYSENNNKRNKKNFRIRTCFIFRRRETNGT